MTDIRPEVLNAVFGPGTGASPEERAKSSNRLFVRSIDQLVEERPTATGRRLTAREALEAYGFEKLVEVAFEGSALLATSRDAVGKVLRDRRSQLALEVKHVATRARVTPDLVEAAENSKRLPIREYEKIARALGLDERFLSVRSEPKGNERVAVRLRTLGDEDPRMTPTNVSALAEAAWVALTQVRLENALPLRRHAYPDDRNPNYGTPDFPAHKWGYFLARKTRDLLGLGDNEIPSMRALVEKDLGIPIVQTHLGESIAGATVETGDSRTIVVNIDGWNREAPIRRATIAHELEHILYDTEDNLNSLRVDDYDELARFDRWSPDPVEQRANAFAAEFLLPQKAAVLVYDTSKDPVGDIMEKFGVSFTLARYQIWNGLSRGIPIESLQTQGRRDLSHWEGTESFTVDYHPLAGLRPSRAGRFGALALRAAEEGVVSWDTAANWLETSVQELKQKAGELQELFPEVWEALP